MFHFAENILAVIAAAYEPLSLEQIAYLNGYSDIPLDMLAVIREINYILDFKRTPEGTKLRLANEVFRNQLYERYRDRISRQVDGWLDMLRMTGQGKIDWMNSADMDY